MSELLLIDDEVVARSYHHLCLRVDGLDVVGSPCDAGSGIAACWLKQNLVAVDFGQYTQEIMDKTTMYPISMYPESMQFILTYLIPIGWVSFYPVSSLLGIDNGLSGGMSTAFITLAIGLFMMFLAGAYFNSGLKKYESAGN